LIIDGYTCVHHGRGHVVSQHTERQLIKLLDPDGVDFRWACSIWETSIPTRKVPAWLPFSSYAELKPYDNAINVSVV